MSLLEAMKRHGVNDLVFSSTCATYGVPRDDFLSENHVQHPINPYGKSKYFVDDFLLCDELAENPLVWFRVYCRILLVEKFCG